MSVLLLVLVGLPPLAPSCPEWAPGEVDRNPTASEIRCLLDVVGPGRFGRIEYAEVAVYQPATPLPGTHVVGVAGLPGPRPGESFEGWEWRLLRLRVPAEARRVRNELELADPRMAERLLRLESALRREGIPFRRLETWRSEARQAYLFQAGRSRPEPLATATLTSWHGHRDRDGRPAALAADYRVPARWRERFHELAAERGLRGFGADSNDPGHVFWLEPARHALPLALIRLLPPVPVVTLASGRPRTEPLRDRAASIRLRERALAFVSGPSPDRALPRPTVPRPGAAPRLEPVRPRAAAAAGLAGS